MLVRPHRANNGPTPYRGFAADPVTGIALTLDGTIVAHFARSSPPPTILKLWPQVGAGDPVTYGRTLEPTELEPTNTARGGFLWELAALGSGIFVLSHCVYTIYFEIVQPADEKYTAYVAWFTDERARATIRAHEIARQAGAPPLAAS